MGTAIKQQKSDDEIRSTLHDIVAGARTIVLLTRGEGDKIEGRPMANIKTDEDTTVYLVTGMDSKKVDELRQTPHVSLSIHTVKGYAMIDGEARVSQDRALIEELWTDDFKSWFTGKDDPNIAVVIVQPNEGTVWEQGIANGLSYLWRKVKSRVTGQEMELKPADEAKVRFRH